MHQPENTQLLKLLVKVHHETLRDYYYFPDVIYAGTQRLEKEEMDLLLSEGYITEQGHDSFGKFYRTSKKAEDLIYSAIVSRIHKRRKQIKTTSRQCTLELQYND